MRIGINLRGAAARRVLATLVCGAAAAMLAACEPSPLSRRQSTALQSPTDLQSNETQSRETGVPLITIEGPRDVHDTIHIKPLDSDVDLMPATSTAPAPATAPVEESQAPNGTIDLMPKGTPPAPK